MIATAADKRRRYQDTIKYGDPMPETGACVQCLRRTHFRCTGCHAFVCADCVPGDTCSWCPVTQPVTRTESEPCQCGNTPHTSGFDPCDVTGSRIEPDAGSDWPGLYVCNVCGIISRVSA